MGTVLAALCVGVVFSLGLGLAGMTQPAKIIGFLDFGGSWDPSLLLVMAGAIAVYLPVWRLMKRRGVALNGEPLAIPAERGLDWRLLVGAAVFGIGWGLAGYCPGPAITSVAGGMTSALVFVASMIGGMVVHAALSLSAPAGGRSGGDG
ncbi:MAG: DUF6691 family protein [Polyangiaceae bacterium]